MFYNSLISALDTGNSVFLGELFGRYWGVIFIWNNPKIAFSVFFFRFCSWHWNVGQAKAKCPGNLGKTGSGDGNCAWLGGTLAGTLWHCVPHTVTLWHTWWHTGTLQWALDKCENTTTGGHRRIHQNYSAQNRYFDDRRVQEFWQEPKTGPKQKPSAGEPRPASPDIKKTKMEYSFL